jgi:hypothetical protein
MVAEFIEVNPCENARMANRAVKYGVVFGVTGSAIALALLVYDYFFLVSAAGINTATVFDQWLFLGLCPPSMALMGMERSHGIGLMIGLLSIILLNGALYAAIGLVLGSLMQVLSPRR